MALLRQCLQELRVKRHEWAPCEDVWPESKPSHVDDSLRAQHAQEQGRAYRPEFMDAGSGHADVVCAV